MAEPRKPRVIRTRPGTGLPAGTETSGTESSPTDAAGKPVEQAGAVRSTSAKVSVERLPEVEQDEADQPKPPSWKIPSWKSVLPKTGAGKSGAGQAGATQAGEGHGPGVDTSGPEADGSAVSAPETALPKAKVPNPARNPAANSVPKVKAPTAPAHQPAGNKSAGNKPAGNKPAGKTQSTPGAKAKAGKAPASSSTTENSTPGSSNGASSKMASSKLGGPKRATATAAGDSGRGGDAQVLAFPVPEHKRRRRNMVYTVTGLVAVLALIMAVALFSPALAVKTVAFEGNKLVAEDVLQSAVAPILSKPLPQVTDAQVQELLSSVVQVKSSHIEAKPPSTLLIHVVERVPVALLKNEEEYLLVDQDGVQLGSTADPASVALPVIDGGKAAIGQDTFRAMTAVLANLPQSILGQLANATAESPDAVELKLADGRSVIWGNASDMELKAQVLEALLNALRQRQRLENPLRSLPRFLM